MISLAYAVCAQRRRSRAFSGGQCKCSAVKEKKLNTGSGQMGQATGRSRARTI